MSELCFAQLIVKPLHSLWKVENKGGFVKGDPHFCSLLLTPIPLRFLIMSNIITAVAVTTAGIWRHFSIVYIKSLRNYKSQHSVRFPYPHWGVFDMYPMNPAQAKLLVRWAKLSPLLKPFCPMGPEWKLMRITKWFVVSPMQHFIFPQKSVHSLFDFYGKRKTAMGKMTSGKQNILHI